MFPRVRRRGLGTNGGRIMKTRRLITAVEEFRCSQACYSFHCSDQLSDNLMVVCSAEAASLLPRKENEQKGTIPVMACKSTLDAHIGAGCSTHPIVERLGQKSCRGVGAPTVILSKLLRPFCSFFYHLFEGLSNLDAKKAQEQATGTRNLLDLLSGDPA